MSNEKHERTIEESSAVGNAAAMREALEKTQSVIATCMEILNKIPDGCDYDGLVDEVADELCDLRDSHVKSALSAPPRNCDKYNTADKAYNGFKEFCDKSVCSECRFNQNATTCRLSWLFSEAEGEVKMSIPKIKAVIEFEGKNYRVVGDISSWFKATNRKLDAIKTDGCIHNVKLIEEVSNG